MSVYFECGRNDRMRMQQFGPEVHQTALMLHLEMERRQREPHRSYLQSYVKLKPKKSRCRSTEADRWRIHVSRDGIVCQVSDRSVAWHVCEQLQPYAAHGIKAPAKHQHSWPNTGSMNISSTKNENENEKERKMFWLWKRKK
jgi:hypothetical protein